MTNQHNGPDDINIPSPMGVYFMVGAARFHLTIESGRVCVRCSDSGGSPDGERLFVHMPAGNKVLIEVTRKEHSR